MIWYQEHYGFEVAQEIASKSHHFTKSGGFRRYLLEEGDQKWSSFAAPLPSGWKSCVVQEMGSGQWGLKKRHSPVCGTCDMPSPGTLDLFKSSRTLS